MNICVDHVRHSRSPSTLFSPANCVELELATRCSLMQIVARLFPIEVFKLSGFRGASAMEAEVRIGT